MNDFDDSLIAGWYGKIPSLGDFISRRLPESFRSPWDTWLQRAISSSRAQLGEHWLNLYLTSPIWRFILMPGICGDNLWIGVLMPSIDRVGRHFPLTIALQIKPYPEVLFAAFSAHAWYASLEQIALTTLNVNISPEDIDQKLINYPFPKFKPDNRSIQAQELVGWWQIKPQAGLVNHKTLTLPTVNILAEQFEAVAKNIFMTAGQGKSIWWKVSKDIGNNEGATQLHFFTGLPQENHFTMLLSNDAL